LRGEWKEMKLCWRNDVLPRNDAGRNRGSALGRNHPFPSPIFGSGALALLLSHHGISSACAWLGCLVQSNSNVERLQRNCIHMLVRSHSEIAFLFWSTYIQRYFERAVLPYFDKNVLLILSLSRYQAIIASSKWTGQSPIH
jgi:hypothetical protein